MSLTAIILSNNEAAHIQDCVASVAWATHVLVVDSGSTDNTQALAAAAGAELRFNAFQHYAQQRNDALGMADTEWVFFLDADERCTPALQEELLATLQASQHEGYFIPRHNYIFGRLTLHTGWYPDYQMRLLKREAAHYDPAIQVHEVVRLASTAPGYLQNPIVHYNYRDVAQFHAKQRRYTELDAHTLYRQGVKPKLYTPYLQPFRHFKWRFWDLAGYRDGLHGLRLSCLMAWYEHRKYARLSSLWRSNAPR